MSQPYAMSWRPQIFRHFPASVYLVRDEENIRVDDSHQDLIIQVRSGQYFASLAMQLENLSNDPYIELDTLKQIMQKYAEELLYLQDAYKIVES